MVFHEKNGRQHVHVVWCRTDLDTMTMRSDSHNYQAHERASLRMERSSGTNTSPANTPSGTAPNAGFPRRYQPCRAPAGQRAGLSAHERRAQMAALKESCDSGTAFKAAVEDAGYILARGRYAGFCAHRAGRRHVRPQPRLENEGRRTQTFMADVDRDTLLTASRSKGAAAQQAGHRRRSRCSVRLSKISRPRQRRRGAEQNPQAQNDIPQTQNENPQAAARGRRNLRPPSRRRWPPVNRPRPESSLRAPCRAAPAPACCSQARKDRRACAASAGRAENALSGDGKLSGIEGISTPCKTASIRGAARRSASAIPRGNTCAKRQGHRACRPAHTHPGRTGPSTSPELKERRPAAARPAGRLCAGAYPLRRGSARAARLSGAGGRRPPRAERRQQEDARRNRRQRPKVKQLALWQPEPKPAGRRKRLPQDSRADAPKELFGWLPISR